LEFISADAALFSNLDNALPNDEIVLKLTPSIKKDRHHKSVAQGMKERKMGEENSFVVVVCYLFFFLLAYITWVVILLVELCRNAAVLSFPFLQLLIHRLHFCDHARQSNAVHQHGRKG
jgi:hypothetical protein